MPQRGPRAGAGRDGASPVSLPGRFVPLPREVTCGLRPGDSCLAKLAWVVCAVKAVLWMTMCRSWGGHGVFLWTAVLTTCGLPGRSPWPAKRTWDNTVHILWMKIAQVKLAARRVMSRPRLITWLIGMPKMQRPTA